LMAELDGNVMIFMALICFIAPFAFGLLPALRASREDVSQALNESSVRSAGGRHGSRLRGLLVGAQVSLALMLMVVAGLVVRTVINLQQLELGFDPDGVLSMRLDLPETKYGENEEIQQFYHGMMEQVGGLSAVSGVALVSSRPATEEGPKISFEIEGRPVPDELERPTARRVIATPGYLDLMRIPILRGRGFTREDTEESIPVVLVSREMAEHHWADDNPVGQRIRIGDESAPWTRVVGIVGDLLTDDVGERPEHHIYLPFAQNARSSMVTMVRSQLDATDLAPLVRRGVWSLDPDQPIDDVQSMEQALYDEMSGAYAVITLFVSFAFFALAMATIGIYGVTSYSIAQQAGEIGIRMAMGAEPAHVLKMILGQAGKLVALGSLGGLAGAFLISRLLASLMFGVSALDPVTFISVPALLVSIALLASYLPARRATRIDPVAVLRAQ
jgi:putative ABC transport system permease protein